MVLVVALSGLTPNSGHSARKGIEAPSIVSFDAIPVCFDFGCKSRDVVSLPITQWAQIGTLFQPQAPNAAMERKQISRAIGAMESLIGQYTPTHKDLAFGLPADDNTRDLFPGQQDCIDEAVNTTTYLRLFEQSGFLTHHTVLKQVYRRSLITQHWAGQIREIQSGQRWAIDSWFRPNGHEPIIRTAESWEDLSLFSYLRNKARKNKKEGKPGFWKRLLNRD